MTTKKAIVLAGDNRSLTQLTTTIKSVCAHNQHIKFYVLHEDIAKEWFIQLQYYLNQLHCDIINVKLHSDMFPHFSSSHEHINHVAYFRYAIPNYVRESIALYLDFDTIVTDDLTELFQLDMSNHHVGAVDEIVCPEFNTGVLLINVDKWKEDDITQQLIQLTQDNIHTITNGDQSIFNLLFENHYLSLPPYYNVQIGFDGLSNQNPTLCADIDTHKPIIIHYLTSNKPWNTYNSPRLREVWWFFYHLDWQAIIHKWTIENQRTQMFHTYSDKMIFILTNSCHIAHLEQLICGLTNYQFVIAAYTSVAPSLSVLDKYDNVFIYPNVLSMRVNTFLDQCSAYLDINFENEVDSIVSRAKEKNKFIATFSHTKHKDDTYYHAIIPEHSPEDMIQILKSI